MDDDSSASTDIYARYVLGPLSANGLMEKKMAKSTLHAAILRRCQLNTLGENT